MVTTTPPLDISTWFEVSPSATGNTTITLVTGVSSPSNLSNASQLYTDVGNVQIAFDLDGNSSLVLTDFTGHCTATNHGATSTSSGYNGIDGAAAFNGSSYIDAGCVGTIPTSGFSVEFWQNSTNASGQSMVGNWDSAQQNGFLIQQVSDALYFYLGTGASGTNICRASPSQVTTMTGAPGIWQHVVAVYNGGNATSATSYQFYVNGQPTGCYMSQTAGSTYSNSSGDILFGRWVNASFPDYYTGSLSRIRVYSKVLTQGQIQTMWFNGIFPSQSGYYGSTNALPTYGLDQLQPFLQMSTAADVFNKAFTTGNLLMIGRTTSTTASNPSGCGATWSAPIVSDTSGISGSANIYIWIGTGASSAPPCTVTLPSGVVGHGYELSSAVSTTVDVSNHGNLSQSGQVNLPALTTTVNGDFMFAFAIGNVGALGMLTPAVSNTMPQWNAGAALSGTNATLAEEYAFTGTNGSYAGSFDNYCAQVTGGSSTAEQYVQFALKPASITIETSSIPSASLTHAYSYTLQAVGGAGAYTWSLSSGSMPAGLTLNSNGVITGTPIGPTTTPTFKVTDGTNTATKALAVTVNSTTGSCSVVSYATTSSASSTITLSSVVAGNLIIAETLTANDHYTQLPTDNLSTPTPYKFINTVNSRGAYLVQQLSVFEGIAQANGTATITSNCDSGGTCYGGAVQLSGCQVYFDNTTGIIANSQNVPGVVTTYAPPLYAPSTEFGWGYVAGNTNNGGGDMNYSAGSGWTGDTSSGSSGVGDMLGVHQSASGGITAAFAQNASTGATPQQVYFGMVLRPTTSGVVGSSYSYGVVF